MNQRQPETRNITPMAAGFEASLAIVAIGLGWLLGVNPLETLTWKPAAMGWGVAAAVPLFVMLWLIVKFPRGPFRKLIDVVDTLLLTMFHGASLAELAVVALMAGIGEELLFRGVVQTALAQWTASPSAAVLVAGVLFGLIHSVTRTYAALAAVVGVYLGWVWLATGNMLAPVVAHAVYDFGALWYLRHTSPRRTDFQSVP